MTATIEQMEAQHGLRYERSPWGLFPVTHKLDGTRFPYSGMRAGWGLISIGNIEIVNWSICTHDGDTIIHGTEQNLERSASGYRRMLRRALAYMRSYGGVRVYTRNPQHRLISPSVDMGRRCLPCPSQQTPARLR